MAPRPSPKVIGGALAAVLALAGGIVSHYEGNPTTAYADNLPTNPTPTACEGHTGRDVVVGKAYTPEQCAAWKRADLLKAHAMVVRCIHVSMTTGQTAALTDAAYNIGPSIVCGSTLQRMANAGNWRGACAQLSRWVYAGGKKLAGLVRRRASERQLCEGAP